ncbi:MAG TPA: type I DNA topoisomerase, partial [Candidatus Paceibacterota bacterium]|nr:type I DNA topoisomerase [Candidatus Paceibacterota bacterium]
MEKTLIIVESPTKAKTIESFLNKQKKAFTVVASKGHVRDLPKSKLGVDVENNFVPQYIIPTKAKKTVTELKKLAAQSPRIILATDEDREGEAIAWHIKYILDNDTAVKKEHPQIERITFHEITAPAIEAALNSPRDINLHLVDAQQARRVLDRLVGYNLSPFLWKKIMKGLSAGRVQSAALKIIVDREREIKAFEIKPYYLVLGNFVAKKLYPFNGDLSKINATKVTRDTFKNINEANKVATEVKTGLAKITSLKSSQISRHPYPPFTTSTLQQGAWNKLHFSAKKTMSLAQELYEGISFNGKLTGLITYMRTDSLNISHLAIEAAEDYLVKAYGVAYSIKGGRFYKNKAKLAQEAHEAIRPTNPQLTPVDLKTFLSPDQYKLYALIWNRFLMSQMPDATYTNVALEITVTNSNKFVFNSTLKHLDFDGHLKIENNTTEEGNVLPTDWTNIFKVQSTLDVKEIEVSEHQTEPPARYNEASLIKTLEEYGIGRPSTYAPIISTLENRYYMEKDNRAFVPTPLGIQVCEMLETNFPQIVDFNFTATIENNFDDIAENKIDWIKVIRDFYGPFKANLDEKYNSVVKIDTTEKTDEVCEKCGSPMIIRTGRFGKFLACSNFPKCKNTKTLKQNQLNIKCPK